LLEYYFGFRLPHPVPALKILNENRKKEFYRLFHEWYDVNPDEVLSEAEQEEYVKSLNQYTDENLVRRLKELTHSTKKARKLAEVSQNDLLASINYHLKGDLWIKYRCDLFNTTFE
jgi:hypothetical protein